MSLSISALLVSSLLPIALAKGSKSGGGRKGGGRVTTVYVGGGGGHGHTSKTAIIIICSIISAIVLALLIYTFIHYYRQYSRSKAAKAALVGGSYSQVTDMEANNNKPSESKPAKTFWRFSFPKKNKQQVPSIAVNHDDPEKATLASPSSAMFQAHPGDHHKYDDPYDQSSMWKISSANTSYSNLSSPTHLHMPLPPYSADDDKQPMLSPPRSPSPYERSDDKTPTMPMPSYRV